MTDFREVSTSQHEAGQEGRVATFKATQLIWLLLGLLEALLALRFIFKLVGVNAANAICHIFLLINWRFSGSFCQSNQRTCGE